MNDYDRGKPSGDLGLPELWCKIMRETALSISQQALKNDKRIENMAAYQVTKGYTDMPQKQNPYLPSAQEFDGQPDNVMLVETYLDKLGKAFSDLKGLVMRGTFTLDELEDRVYAQYGIVSEEAQIKAGVLPKDKQFAEDIKNIWEKEETK